MKEKLHRHRSSTREFLVSKADASESGRGLADKGPDISLASVLDHLSKEFPDILSGKPFTDAAMSRLNASSQFGAMAIRVDAFFDLGMWKPEEKTDAEKYLLTILSDAARTLNSVCGSSEAGEMGIWGLIEQGVFGCFFPGKDEASSLNLAETIQTRFASHRKRTLTIGIASHPLIHFSKYQILENACKALEHGIFSGLGSMAAFNAVTLNISGDKLYQQGDIPEAIKEFKRALMLDPANLNVHNSLGVCYGAMGVYDKAFEAFKSAIRLDTREVMPIYNAGLTTMLMGNRELAIKYLLAAGRVGEDVFEVAFQTGRLYLEVGKPTEAKAFLEKAAGLRPESGAVFRHIGECYAALNMREEAIQTYKKAIKQNPYDAASLSALGHLFEIQEKEIEIATVFCQHSVDISPDNGLYRYRLGRLHLKQKRLDEALDEFVKATERGHDCTVLVEKIQERLADA